MKRRAPRRGEALSGVRMNWALAVWGVRWRGLLALWTCSETKQRFNHFVGGEVPAAVEGAAPQLPVRN